MHSLRSTYFTFYMFDSNFQISYLIDDSEWAGDTERAQSGYTRALHIYLWYRE